MKPQRGYYSLIQFCPDAARLEAVNVGVVLLCPDSKFLESRISHKNRRAERLVGRKDLERAALNAARLSIESRFETDRESFSTLEDLQKFVDTRGNKLILTKPRSIKVFNPQDEIERLFVDLVTGEPKREVAMVAESSRPLFPELENTFQQFAGRENVYVDYHVELPVFHSDITVPYAYQNGKLNLIQPKEFPKSAKRTMKSAMELAVTGDLIKKHGTPTCSDARLVVVSFFESKNAIPKQVDELFGEYNVKHVQPDQLHDFVLQVQQEVSQHPPVEQEKRLFLRNDGEEEVR